MVFCDLGSILTTDLAGAVRGLAVCAQMSAQLADAIEVLIWVAVLLIVLLGGSFAIRKICTEPIQQERDPKNLLTKFRDCHTKGELNDEEFRKIKSMLAGEIGEELRVKDKRG